MATCKQHTTIIGYFQCVHLSHGIATVFSQNPFPQLIHFGNPQVFPPLLARTVRSQGSLPAARPISRHFYPVRLYWMRVMVHQGWDWGAVHRRS